MFLVSTKRAVAAVKMAIAAYASEPAVAPIKRGDMLPPIKDTASTRIDPPIKKQLERWAKAEKRTLSQYIEIVLTKHVEGRTVATP